ncbi:MAG: ribonuclease J [Clostridia bacterium]|nr:ribonuclease J [Clostridia bacterium]
MRNKENKMPSLKVIPIGGLNEIGKNFTLLQYKNQILIIDCGLSFPEDDMYGIDIVIPDFTYLVENKDKIVGMVITHGHEDHIGGIPYLLKQVNVPIYGTKLTLGLIENKLKEHGIKGKLHTVKAGDKIKLGSFNIETIRTTHSIADAICLAIDTPAGLVFHSGDFKIDYTPVDGEPIDLSKLAQIGQKGVLLMMADSTNALRPGYSDSEKVVGQTLHQIFRTAKTRIVVATFSSNVHRVQKIIDNAVLCGRKVAVNGRSMENVVKLAQELGYLDIPAGTLIDIRKANTYPDKQLVIVTTGSQGEPMSALARMASGDHKSVKLKEGDTVILSSTPVPGNEKMVSNVVNRLVEKGCQVIYSDILDVHVSGHAAQEELKLLHSLIKPKYFMPVHGEKRHLIGHHDLAINLGMDPENIFVIENGDVLNVSKAKAEVIKGVVQAEDIMVDGLGVGDVGTAVLNERKALSESGIMVIAIGYDQDNNCVASGPEIFTRGFVYVKDHKELIDQAKEVAAKTLEKCEKKNIKDWNVMKAMLKEDMKNFIYLRTKRSPVILPLFLNL